MVVTLVHKYDPEWPTWFARICAVLRTNLDDTYLRIEHVGSTSVPGMIAKPIIDIDIVIREGGFEAIKEKLARLGYVHEGDLGIAGREAFDLHDEELRAALPAHHLYVCLEDSPELRKHLAFRNFMRNNDYYVERLSRLKWCLAERFENDKRAYMEGKDGLVRQITKLALKDA
jgi:GrpB-like predicted nucleotidyltransferase (UPF0157 family)